MPERGYDVSMVRTLSAALGRPADVHDYAITDIDTGRVKGVYATQELATAALFRLTQPGGMYVLTVLHPATCDCVEAL